jgi:hypothetical protein
MIPRQHRERLLAAFNGGFKEEHGHHGMFVGGTTLVPLRPELCTVVGYADGSVRIGTWHVLRGNPAVGEGLDGVEFLRQAAPCMVEQGSLHAGLRDETTRRWGATLEGTTVIRRSAIGLDRTRTVLFFAVSNDTTARAIAEAMHHAGADDVAQLDVNWSYPKFLLFPRDAEGNRFARGLFEGFLFEKRDYVSRPSARDFFYLARR